MSIDTTKLREVLGNYYRQRYPEIVQKFKESNELSKIFKPITMIKDQLVVTEASVTRVMQPYQKAWTPMGSLKLSPELLQLRYAKADIEVDPNELRATFYADYLPGAPSEEHEIVRLAYDMWLKQAAEDTCLALVQGKYANIIAGSVGTPEQVVDGLLEFIRQQITLKKITPKILGAIDSTNIVSKVEELYMSIPSSYRQKGKLECYMSETMRRKYFSNYRDLFGMMTDYNGWDGNIDSTNIKIVSIPYMDDSNRIIITIKDNIRTLQGRPQDMFKFEIQKDKRQFNFLMDWGLGIGAMIVGEPNNPSNQYIWCNELDVPTQTTNDAGSGSGSGI